MKHAATPRVRVTVRLSTTGISLLDTLAEQHHITRSEALRRVLKLGLAAAKDRPLSP